MGKKCGIFKQKGQKVHCGLKKHQRGFGRELGQTAASVGVKAGVWRLGEAAVRWLLGLGRQVHRRHGPDRGSMDWHCALGLGREAAGASGVGPRAGGLAGFIGPGHGNGLD